MRFEAGWATAVVFDEQLNHIRHAIFLFDEPMPTLSAHEIRLEAIFFFSLKIRGRHTEMVVGVCIYV